LGKGDLTLTWYQGAFIRHLAALEVPTIVIGGKARSFHTAEFSFDLDLWMPTDNSPNSIVHRCLVEWSVRYPNHRLRPIAEPFELAPTTMVQFPDADVQVLTDLGEIEKVDNKVRIDILFGLPGFAFEATFEKAEVWERGGRTVRILSQDLLCPTAKLKPV
jgi:hypothetical protein